MGILCRYVVGTLPYAHYVISFPLRGVRVLHSVQCDVIRGREGQDRSILILGEGGGWSGKGRTREGDT